MPAKRQRIDIAIAASALLTLSLIFASSTLAAEPNFPKLTGRVVDDAGILDPHIRDLLGAMSADQENSTGNQVVVVTVKSLQGDSIEDFGYQLGRYWGIGQKGRNNGVILLVAPNDRAVRIEVGYGLEWTLTDAQCRLIIDQSILPAFKRSEFNSGVLSGMQAILLVLGGNTISPKSAPENQLPPGWWVGLSLMGLLGAALWIVLRRLPSVPLASSTDEKRIVVSSSGRSFGGSSGRGGFSGGGGSFGGGGASGSW